MQPTTGRIVHYKLTAEQAEQVNRRRTTSSSIAARAEDRAWPLGAQAHIGNHASPGDVLPLVIVRVWPDEFGAGKPGVNGQVLLDGNDTLWVTSAAEGNEAGQWSWPPRS